jgi:hypothetical protein
MARLVPLLALLLVAGCASAPKPAAAPPPPPGMELVLGQPAEQAVSLLGKPRLDRREGPAQQLQFGGACILDIFYYQQPGAVPLATHADSRLPDGRAFAPGECLQMLLRARSVPAAANPPAAPPRSPARRG